jgi:sulfatase maturation enzyme AslB (radical SAM superfamily)
MDTYNKVIVIEVSTVCNLSCPFCAHDSRLRVKRHTIEHERLKAFIHAIGEFSMAKKESILISWLGGEPFINKSILPLTEELIANYPLFFSATTNGTKLSDPVIRDHIKRCYAELTVSVDGFASFHDKMRGRAGLFEEVSNCVRLLAREAPDLKIRINTVLMRQNFDMFPELCIEFASWGIKEITFNQLGGRDRPEFYPENRLLGEQVAKLPEYVSCIEKSISNTQAKLIFSESYFRRILATARGEKLPILDCKPGSYYMFVNAQGKISPCSFTTDEYGEDISSIQVPADFEKLPLIFHQKKAGRQAYYCHDCPCTNVHGKFS